MALPAFKPYTGKEKIKFTETDRWLAEQEKRYQGGRKLSKQNGGWGASNLDTAFYSLKGNN